MPKQLVITVTDEVYEELQRRAGQDDVSTYVARLVEPQILSEHDLEEGYRAMAADVDREREALEWIELEPGDALP
jgi:predicted CopG family antitoxin